MWEAVSSDNPQKGQRRVLGLDKMPLQNSLTLEGNLSYNNCQDKSIILDRANYPKEDGIFGFER